MSGLRRSTRNKDKKKRVAPEGEQQQGEEQQEAEEQHEAAPPPQQRALEEAAQVQLQLKQLREGVDMLLHSIETGTSMDSGTWMRLYTLQYNMCDAGHNEGVYAVAVESLRGYIEEILRDKVGVFSGETMLKRYLLEYRSYRNVCLSVRGVFAYLTRTFIDGREAQGFQRIFPLAIRSWRDMCFADNNAVLRDSTLDLLDSERSGAMIDRELVKEFVNLLHDLGQEDEGRFYERHFESYMLERALLYYRREGVAHMQKDSSVSNYLKHATARIRKEEVNGAYYFLESTLPKLRRTLNEAITEPHREVIEAEFAHMIDAERHEDMRLVFVLFERLDDGLAGPSRILHAHVVRAAMQIMDAQKAIKETKKAIDNAIPFVKEMLALHAKYAAMVADCFRSAPAFLQAMDRAFQETVNRDKATGRFTVSKLLAYYVDRLLQGKLKVEAHEMDGALEEVAVFFTYFQDKDSFAEHVRKNLCKRLLAADSSSFNEAAEQTFININDAASKALADDFSGRKVGRMELQVKVLNESHWPISGSEKFSLALSEPMQKCVSAFEEYYDSKTDKRKLRWLYNTGTVLLRSHFGKGGVQLEVSPLQAEILQQFNGTTAPLSFHDIAQRLWPQDTVLHYDMLRYAMVPLIFTKHIAPLRRESGAPLKQALEGDDMLRVRSSIKTKKKRIRFKAGSAAKDKKDSDDVEKQVAKQREFELDACIVRIMKSRNALTWQELQAEAVRALRDRFRPQVRSLKRRLESLIERNFVKRDEQDAKMIVYKA